VEWQSPLYVRRGKLAPKGLAVHAAAFLRERRLVVDAELRRDPVELRRILAHELFHFTWVRLGNPKRLSWEDLLQEEWRAGTRGELGWSSESRKEKLRAKDCRARARRWREYLCESYCDTGAWMVNAAVPHEEYTLPGSARRRRAGWFRPLLERGLET
jgi:hypothetical protein